MWIRIRNSDLWIRIRIQRPIITNPDTENFLFLCNSDIFKTNRWCLSLLAPVCPHRTLERLARQQASHWRERERPVRGRNPRVRPPQHLHLQRWAQRTPLRRRASSWLARGVWRPPMGTAAGSRPRLIRFQVIDQPRSNFHCCWRQ